MTDKTWVQNIADSSQDKVLILIKSRLHEEDTFGFISDIGKFDVLELPLLFTGNVPKSEFIDWCRI